jgi:SAM-dependent methyltransferase
MNENQMNIDLKQFWNNQFTKLEPTVIKTNEVKEENSLDKFLKYLGDHSEKILDIGTGSGYGLLTAKILGEKAKYGLGIDPSLNAINFLNKTCEMSDIKGICGQVGDHKILENELSESFDGIICSNVVDVVPEKTANEIIREIQRLLKPNGILVLKINFYLTEELIKKIKMEEVDTNAYAINGILRGVNYTLDEWINRFDGFEVIEREEYERIPNGPKDRVLLLRKL